MSCIIIKKIVFHEFSQTKVVVNCTKVQLYVLEMMVGKLLTEYEESQKAQQEPELKEIETN